MVGLGFMLDLAIVSLVAGVSAFLCKKIQLSAVVGFLLAGMIVGPYTPPFQLVEDADRIRVLADLGLVFLIFGIGLGFSIRRIQRLGAAPLIATAIGALLVLAGVRLASSALGFTTQQSLFIAGVLMVSSSAVISKVLEEIGANHSRWGQLALAVTLLEDIVSVMMLTLLGSFGAAEGEGSGGSFAETLASFSGFVALFALAALLLVPMILRFVKKFGNEEILILCTTGLLLSFGWVAVQLGYSMALTAFILGAIVGSTPQKPDVEKLFEGMRLLFGAIFFVAMGMLFDVKRLPEFWPGMLALVGAAFLLRIPATATALTLTGNKTTDALRASFTLTPLGEFSFVIAFLGSESGIMGENFYPAAVGASLITCLLSPALMRKAEPLSGFLLERQPRPLARALSSYAEWLDQVRGVRSRSQTWSQLAPALGSAAVHALLIAGCIALATPAYRLAWRHYGPDLLFPFGTTVLFLAALGVLLLPPGIAIWRSFSRAAALLARSLSSGEGAGSQKALIEKVFLLAGVGLAALWLLAVLPIETLPPPVLGVVGLGLIVAVVLLWRTLAQWHERLRARVEVELQGAASASEGTQTGWAFSEAESQAEWRLQAQEVTLPTNSSHAGKRLADLNLRSAYGCSIAGVDRGGFAINNPSGQERLYPEDRLLLLGHQESVGSAVEFLRQTTDRPIWFQQFDELATEPFDVPPHSPAVGKSLAELDLMNRYGVQIAAIRRGADEVVSPSAKEIIRVDDELLLLGSHENITRCVIALSDGRQEAMINTGSPTSDTQQ